VKNLLFHGEPRENDILQKRTNVFPAEKKNREGGSGTLGVGVYNREGKRVRPDSEKKEGREGNGMARMSGG